MDLIRIDFSNYYLPDRYFKYFALCEVYPPFQTGDYHRNRIPKKAITKKQADIESLWASLSATKPTQLWVADPDYPLFFDILAFKNDAGQLILGEKVMGRRISQDALLRAYYRIWCLQRMGHTILDYSFAHKEGFLVDKIEVLDKMFEPLVKDKVIGFVALLNNKGEPIEPLPSYNLCSFCYKRKDCAYGDQEPPYIEYDLEVVKSIW